MKKTGKKLMAAVIAAAVLAAAGCGGTQKAESTAAGGADTEAAEGTDGAAENTADRETYRIGVLQLTQHPALDAANEGFVEALDEAGISYEIDQQNASGDTATCTTIAQKLVNDKDDLIFAIATGAAQACAAETTDIPIVLTAVTDPAESGLTDSNDAPGGNITGSSDLTPVADQIKLVKQVVPDAKTVGVLYCSAESNSAIQVALAHEACEAEGLTAVDYAVASSNDIQTVVDSMKGKVDVIYAPTDNTIAAGMATVAMIANENGIPTICGEEGMCNAGGLVTYTIDYKELGKVAGEMAVEILTEGKNPAEMPIRYYPEDKLKLIVNEETAETLGIDPSAITGVAE